MNYEHDRRLTQEILGHVQILGKFLKDLPNEYRVHHEIAKEIDFDFLNDTKDDSIDVKIKTAPRGYTHIPSSFPPDMRTPAFLLLRNTNRIQAATSPYGVLPLNLFFDKTGTLFQVRNEFTFNGYGQRKKRERIISLNLGNETREQQLQAFFYKEMEVPEFIPLLDVIASPDDSRFVPFAHGDYEAIGRMVKDILSGTMKPVLHAAG